VVGGYRLVKRLGSGGMATVYLAERIEARFEHRVAIKIVRPGAAADALARRFQDEQQILASLNHPNIAQLYSGGVTDDGVPYMIMELVDGVPINHYCDDHRLSIEQRIDLFRTACEAVEHAHSNLVVHRDLKPSNILVAKDGTVKLLDFGVAKLMAASTAAESEPSTVTSLYGTPVTPEYAAPEQVLGGSVTTAVDVYSLGVLLYELLTGRRPLGLPSRDPLQIVAAVADARFDRPSQTIRRQAAPAGQGTDDPSLDGIAAVAARRNTTPRKLVSRLRGDLDTIVMSALRREPEQRCASVTLLREDLERHRMHRPVKARPESWPYIIGRFVRRHRVAVSLSAGVVLALIVGLITAVAGQRAAHREAQTADRVSRFLVELLRAPDPNFGRGGDTTAAELLQEASHRISTELESEPDVRATLLMVIGESSLAVGEHELARSLVEEGAALWEELRGPDHEKTIAARNMAAVVAGESGDLVEAEKRFTELMSVLSSASVSPERKAIILNDYGMLLREQGRFGEAERRYRQALDILREHGNLDSQQGARALNNLAMAVRRQDRIDEAEALLEETLRIQRATLTEPHVDIARTLNNLGALRRQKGDLEGAEDLDRQAFTQRNAVLGDLHPEVAQSLNNLGAIRYYRGDLAGAADAFERALEIWRHFFAEDHPRVADALSNLGSIRRDQRRLDDAEQLFAAAAAMLERLHGGDHLLVGQTLHKLGAVRMQLRRPKDAQPALKRALQILESTGGADDRHVVATSVALAQCLVELGDRGGALALLSRLETAATTDEAAVALARARTDLGLAGF
jgi:serine/threonine protein kinase/tetratricopeptide (TPR) repeat protein